MKKLIYVSFENSENRSSGVNKKINGQIRAFESENYFVDLIATYNDDIAFYHNNEKKIIKSNSIPRISLCTWAAKNAPNYNIAYVRFQFFCPFVLHMLKAFRQHNVITIMEIPTYPYAIELRKQGLLGIPKRSIDSVFGSLCSRYIDTFASPLYGGIILGRPCLEIYNGIDVNETTPRKPMKNSKIDLIAVAMMAPWHGYDRLINGLHEYYQKGGQRNVILHLVGEGAATPEYTRLIYQYSLEEHVIQHGKKFGPELDALYNYADIGVGALASSSKNVFRTNTLKVLEYMGKGLPVICEEGEVGIPSDSQYRLTIKNGNEAVSIEDVVSFYDSVYTNEINHIISEIRTYCIDNCSVKSGLWGIFEFLQDKV